MNLVTKITYSLLQTKKTVKDLYRYKVDEAVFTEIVACLSESKMVKNKYRRILKS